MQPSRDDFVIAIRSAFLKKGNQQRFSLLGLLLFSLILIILGKYNFKGLDYLRIALKEFVYRTTFIVSLPEKYLGQSYQLVKNHLNLYKNYNITKDKLNELESKDYNINYIVSENNRLKKILDEVNFSTDEQVSKVLIDKKSPFLHSIIINKGSKNNVKKGMAILSNEYLVGKIVEVNFYTSRILLLSDLNSKIPVIIEPNGYHAILSGHGKKKPTLEFLPENCEIEDGSVVYTSGMEGIFDPGLPIGKTSNIEKNITVTPFSDLSQVTFVNIVLENIE